MTMMGARIENNGVLNKDKVLRRYVNLINLAYMQSSPLEDGGYRIPEKVFNLLETEIDFNPPSEEKRAELKKRYRQRNSYCFWKEFLDISNISNEFDAKEYLMKIFTLCDNKGIYGSMTASRYALETLHLAIDDVYGTDNAVFTDNKLFLKKKGVQKVHLGMGKRKTTKKKPKAISANHCVPF